jgi:aryl-alcohol dehydrogenase-like predicted oxidoreductase
VEYRNLGKSGLKVSLVGLGCNNFGGRVDAERTADVVNACIDAGITFFDTADIYGAGKSEEFLAPALKPHRRNIVIATKSAGSMGEGPYWRGASRRYLMDAVDACLRRLETDYIDLYQVHMPDGDTPQEETLRALDDIVRAGKVRYIGCSNYAGWQVADAAWTAKSEHLTPFVSAQNQYSLLERGIERELMPACKQFGLGVLPFFPLASGFLTGKYRPNEAPPEGSRLAGQSPMAGRILSDKNYDSLVKLENFATERGHTMIELAMSWLATQPIISSVIAGATRPEQVYENAKSADWRLHPDEMQQIDEILGVAPAGGPGMGGPRPAAAPARS